MSILNNFSNINVIGPHRSVAARKKAHPYPLNISVKQYLIQQLNAEIIFLLNRQS